MKLTEVVEDAARKTNDTEIDKVLDLRESGARDQGVSGVPEGDTGALLEQSGRTSRPDGQDPGMLGLRAGERSRSLGESGMAGFTRTTGEGYSRREINTTEAPVGNRC